MQIFDTYSILVVFLLCCVLSMIGAVLSYIFIITEQAHHEHHHNHHLPLPPVVNHENDSDIVQLQMLTNVGFNDKEVRKSSKVLKEAAKFNLLRNEESMSVSTTEC